MTDKEFIDKIATEIAKNKPKVERVGENLKVTSKGESVLIKLLSNQQLINRRIS
jgi:hypothetical protein